MLLVLVGAHTLPAESVILQSAELGGGRTGYRLFPLLVTAAPGEGIRVWQYEEFSGGSTILHRELVTGSFDLPIPNFLITAKIEDDGAILRDTTIAGKGVELYRIDGTQLTDAEIAERIRHVPFGWILHPRFGWVHATGYPWVFFLDGGWAYVRFQGHLNAPTGPDNLWVERPADALYDPATPASAYNYPTETSSEDIFRADNAYFLWFPGRGWGWAREAWFPWVYFADGEGWVNLCAH